ncbi:hypothetical protein PG993_003821 [Apiospora rasikravindrae]|uniref:Uncharacterized protein n=1 Tax=Apiospora rasikravindrae TaxID=990691 RepID=A0ABR1U0K5_9PEZI
MSSSHMVVPGLKLDAENPNFPLHHRYGDPILRSTNRRRCSFADLFGLLQRWLTMIRELGICWGHGCTRRELTTVYGYTGQEQLGGHYAHHPLLYLLRFSACGGSFTGRSVWTAAEMAGPDERIGQRLSKVDGQHHATFAFSPLYYCGRKDGVPHHLRKAGTGPAFNDPASGALQGTVKEMGHVCLRGVQALQRVLPSESWRMSVA